MIVTEVEAWTKTKYKIELDGKFAFVLYKGELSRFSVQKGKELPEETVREIKEKVLAKRAKARALHLLNAAPRTEAELKRKLEEGLYPKEITEQAIAYVKSFGYINDYRYALNFIECRQEKKSRREIQALLAQKGLDPETAACAMEEAYAEKGDQEAIRKILERKHFTEIMEDPERLQKVFGYLARKGFRYEDIRRVVQNYEDDT